MTIPPNATGEPDDFSEKYEKFENDLTDAAYRVANDNDARDKRPNRESDPSESIDTDA